MPVLAWAHRRSTRRLAPALALTTALALASPALRAEAPGPASPAALGQAIAEAVREAERPSPPPPAPAAPPRKPRPPPAEEPFRQSMAAWMIGLRYGHEGWGGGQPSAGSGNFGLSTHALGVSVDDGGMWRLLVGAWVAGFSHWSDGVTLQAAYGRYASLAPGQVLFARLGVDFRHYGASGGDRDLCSELDVSRRASCTGDPTVSYVLELPTLDAGYRGMWEHADVELGGRGTLALTGRVGFPYADLALGEAAHRDVGVAPGAGLFVSATAGARSGGKWAAAFGPAAFVDVSVTRLYASEGPVDLARGLLCASRGVAVCLDAAWLHAGMPGGGAGQAWFGGVNAGFGIASR